MQGWQYNNPIVAGATRSDTPAPLPAHAHEGRPRREQLSFGIYSMTPPSTDAAMVLLRADEVSTVRRMLSSPQTSAVFITGEPGAGKSTLAALVYRHLQTSIRERKERLLAPRHFVWLSISSFANLPDVIAAILRSIGVDTSSFFLQNPEQQVATLTTALRRPQESAFIVLDQFEHLLDPETAQGLVGRGAFPAFYEMLMADLGGSRVLLTSYPAPQGSMNDDAVRVRSYLVSRVSIPEGVTLLKQRGLQGDYEDLSLLWQRCAGHVFALLLFCALARLSKLSLSYLLHSPDYQPLWSGDVTLNLLGAVYRFLSPLQSLLLRALCLFAEPVPLQGILMTALGKAVSSKAALFEHELAFLSELSLIQPSLNEEQVTCYELHALLRQYVTALYLEGNDVQQPEQLEAVLGMSSPLNAVFAEIEPGSPEAHGIAVAAGHMRAAAYYQQLASERCPPLEQRSGLQDVAPLLQAIRHLCLGWNWQQACDLLFAEKLHECLMHWGTWNTLIGLYTIMLPPSGVLTRRDEGLVGSHLGLLYARLGDYEQSRVYYEHALAVQRSLPDRRDEAVTLVNMGELFRATGELQQAQTCYEQALLLNNQQPEPWRQIESVALHNLGLLCQAQRNYQQAMQYYQRSLKLAQERQDRYDIGMIITNIGMLLYEQGSQVAGLALLLFALRYRQALQDSSVSAVERFVISLEQYMGQEAYARLQQAALAQQEQLLKQLFATDIV